MERLILKHLIAQGRVRACYYHPFDVKLCVKVSLNKKNDKLLKKEVLNDALFCKTIGPYVPRYYKLVNTNKGLGLVTDLICDKDNKSSQRLAYYWGKHENELPKDLLKQLDDFFVRLLKYHLWFYDFNDYNFVVQCNGKHNHLFFIDTKSLNRNSSWSYFKLEYVCPWLAKIRMLRRIRRFYERHGLKPPAGLC